MFNPKIVDSVSADYTISSYKEDIQIEHFNDEEAKILDRNITNATSNVFAWKVSENLTHEQVGALLSRYSRTSLTGRRLFLKEFYPNKDRGREFFDAWLVDYGDDSIQEMAGGLPLSCEFISNLAVKEIEDCRLGSYIEKSTRYVPFDKKLPNGEYMFYKDPDIMDSRYSGDYLDLMHGLFSSYSANMDRMIGYIRNTNPINGISFRFGESSKKITEMRNGDFEAYGATEEDLRKAYENAIRANALDFLRDYLPMSTLTHVGVSMDARSYENLVHKLMSSGLGEARTLGKRILSEMRNIAPSLLKRVDEEHGLAMQNFMKERRENAGSFVNALKVDPKPVTDSVALVDYTGEGSDNADHKAQIAISGPILYTFSDGLGMKEAMERAKSMGEAGRKGLIAAYVGPRANRRHKPGRAFENVEYLFDLNGRIGIYRDIQRHRIGTQERQNFSIVHGYETRPAFGEIGIEDDYRQKMSDVKSLYQKLHSILPHQAQYAVTFGFDISWYYRLNARQLYHLCELRSSQQGHPDYRKLVQQMAIAAKKVHPTVIEHMRYLNMSDKTLGRLDSEIRIAVKKNAISKQS